MKSLANRTVFRLAYQGLLLLILTVLPKALLNATIIFNFHNNQNFSIIESWLIIISSLFLLALTYFWARKENLLVDWHFTLKDLKSVGWGFILIFLMGMIGSNLMLLTHGIYHDSLQRTLLNVPFLPLATVMLTASFSEELLFRTWLYSWIAPYKKLAMVVSTGLFCLYHLPTNIGHLFLYSGMGIALGQVYQKNTKSYANIILHFLWNSYTLIATLLIMH